MSEEDFLKRWSRRKREAGDVARPDETETNADVDAGTAPANDIAKANAATPEAEAAFDPASLPPVESITALSDATAFLRAGVPADLTRAALRRVWTVDPAIRDFVGLAENAWDFTDPNCDAGLRSAGSERGHPADGRRHRRQHRRANEASRRRRVDAIRGVGRFE